MKEKRKLKEVLRYDVRTVRSYLLREAFDSFWTYKTPHLAEWFLDQWCKRAMRSRLDPIEKFATTLRVHKPLLLNWFRASLRDCLGAVDGVNTNAKFAIKKARRFRTYKVLETTLYHELGRLPEHEFTNRFC